MLFINDSVKIFSRRKLNEGVFLKESIYKTYDELPLFLDAKTVAGVLGISQSSAYELMHEEGFPTLKIGARLVVPKEKFREWVELNTKTIEDNT